MGFNGMDHCTLARLEGKSGGSEIEVLVLQAERQSHLVEGQDCFDEAVEIGLEPGWVLYLAGEGLCEGRKRIDEDARE